MRARDIVMLPLLALVLGAGGEDDGELGRLTRELEELQERMRVGEEDHQGRIGELRERLDALQEPAEPEPQEDEKGEDDEDEPGPPPWRWEDAEGDGEWQVGVVNARFRHEYRDDFDFNDPADDQDNLDHYRVHLRAEHRPEDYPFFRLRGEGRLSRTWGANTQDERRQDQFDLHQGYAELDPLGYEAGWRLRVGRQEMRLARERLIGADEFNNFMRSFDAARLFVGPFSGDEADPTELGLFYGWPVEVEQRDDHAFNKPDQDVVQAGAYFARGAEDGELTLYLLNTRDGNGRSAGELGGVDDTDILTYGLALESRYPDGGIDAEVAWQQGEVGPDDLSAFAASAEIDIRAAPELRPFAGLALGYAFASGDKDPADGKLHAFQELHPSPHEHFGLMDLFAWSNMQDISAGLRFEFDRDRDRDTGGMDLELDYHVFLLEESRGAWLDTRERVLRRDPSGTSGTRVGDELDVVARFRRLNVVYGHFFPRGFVRRSGPNDGADLLYLEVEF